MIAWFGQAVAAPPPADPVEQGLAAVALFQVRTSVSDLVSTNPLLDGQVVGVIGGASGVVVDPAAVAAGTEQRASLFATYAPRLLDGRAAIHSGFEVDFAWGDAAYGVGGNTGGGFGGDQVNLQTRRLSASLRGDRGGAHGRVELGLQWLGDGIADPGRPSPEHLFRTGARGVLFASEAAGILATGHLADGWGPRVRGRVGLFTLAEQGFTTPDDAWIAVAGVAGAPGWRSDVGAHVAWLQDRTGGTGGALGIGPTSPLSGLMGGPDLDLYDGNPVPPDAAADADLVWVYADGGHNAGLDGGDVGVHAVGGALVGRLYAPRGHDDDVFGWFADAELRGRWAPGQGSVAAVEVLATSGDDADPDRYTGMITGNSYGIVGAVWATHGTSLLFSDPGAINRATSVVPDVSNQGRGLRAAALNVGFDPVPNRLTTQAGLATATRADSTWLGTEVHGGLVGRPLFGTEVGLEGAVLVPGPLLDATPWSVRLDFDLWILP